MPPTTVVSALPSTNGATPDPLAELGFRVEIPGVAIGQFAECAGLEVEYDVFEYEEGGNNEFVHRLRGRARYPNLSLMRGVTSEEGLLTWFFRYQKAEQRPTLTVTMIDGSGSAIRRFAFAQAFPVRWTGPSLTAGSNGAATETLEVGHAGLV